MRVAIVGSRDFEYFDISPYIPEETTEIVSGGAKGVDTIAKIYAKKNNLKYTEFRPKYTLYGQGAPLLRNNEIVDYSDLVIAFWDGISHGTKYVINRCRENGVPLRVFMPKNTSKVFAEK